MPKEDIKDRKKIAGAEYTRLISLYKDAGVDDIKLKINDELIRKVAETFAVLEVIKDLPTIVYDTKNPLVQRETAAGKARIKYMAQYTSAMQKLNKDMLGTPNSDGGGDLDDYE